MRSSVPTVFTARVWSRLPVAIKQSASETVEKSWSESCMEQYNVSLTYTLTPGRHVFIDRGGVSLLCSLLGPNVSVLEFGSGGSTTFFSKFVKRWVSVEHSADWGNKVTSLLSSLPWGDRVKMLISPPDLPYCSKCCCPPPEGTDQQFASYIAAPHKLGQKFDLVLDDGRARVGVARAALELLAPGGSLVIHDWERDYYKVLVTQLGYSVVREETGESRHTAQLSPPRH